LIYRAKHGLAACSYRLLTETTLPLPPQEWGEDALTEITAQFVRLIGGYGAGGEFLHLRPLPALGPAVLESAFTLPPTVIPAEVVRTLKTVTGRIVSARWPIRPLWTGDYVLSTTSADDDLLAMWRPRMPAPARG